MARPLAGGAGRRRLAAAAATSPVHPCEDLAPDAPGHRGGTAGRRRDHAGRCLRRAQCHGVGGRGTDGERAAVPGGAGAVPGRRRAVVDPHDRRAGHRVGDARSGPGGLWQRRRLLVVGALRRRRRAVRHVHQPEPLRDLGDHGHPGLLRLRHCPAVRDGERRSDPSLGLPSGQRVRRSGHLPAVRGHSDDGGVARRPVPLRHARPRYGGRIRPDGGQPADRPPAAPLARRLCGSVGHHRRRVRRHRRSGPAVQPDRRHRQGSYRDLA